MSLAAIGAAVCALSLQRSMRMRTRMMMRQALQLLGAARVDTHASGWVGGGGMAAATLCTCWLPRRCRVADQWCFGD